MAIKHHIAGGKGTYWPPYTAAEKRQMDADLYRKPHSGPYVVVYPHARGGSGGWISSLTGGALRYFRTAGIELTASDTPVPTAFAAFPTP